MEIEIARVRYEVDQAEIDERHDVQEKQNRLQELLPIGPRISCRAEFLFNYSGVNEWVRHDQLTEVQWGSKREVGDRRGVDRACVDRAGDSVWLRQQREQIGLERP